MISECNAMSEELDKKVKFEPILVSPQSRGKKDGRPEVSYVKWFALHRFVVNIHVRLQWDTCIDMHTLSENSFYHDINIFIS